MTLAEQLTSGTSARAYALGRCVCVPPEVFARKYWATGPLHSAAGSLPRDFADLFSPAAADELLTDRALRTPFIRMAKEGTVLSGDCFTASGGFGAAVADQVDPAMVLREFAAARRSCSRGCTAPGPRCRRSPACWWPNSGTRPRSTPTSRRRPPRVRPALRRARRVRAAGQRGEALAHPRPGAHPSPGRRALVAVPGRGERPRPRGTRTGRGDAAGRRAVPAARLAALRGRAGRHLHPPDHWRGQLHRRRRGPRADGRGGRGG